MGGIIRFPNGRSSPLMALDDPGLVEQWLLRSVQPMNLWNLTVPLLPVGENLATPFGTIVPILGIDGEGQTIAVLFDLQTERPITTTLGESIAAIHWAESLDEKQLEAFARYFWHDPKASLIGVWSQVYGLQVRNVSLCEKSQVQVLSWRPRFVLLNLQAFLQRYGLPICFFGLYTLQSEQGEVVAIAEPIALAAKAETISSETQSVRKIGDIEAFLKFVEGMEKL